MTSKAQPADPAEKCNLGTFVPSRGLVLGDPVVQRFHVLQARLFHGVPDMARAYVTLAEHLPLLREMQALLSQRPLGRKRIQLVTPIGGGEQLPTWTAWITEYALHIGYCVRHIRRAMTNEPRTKTVKECGWSVSDHNNLLRAASLSFELVKAIEAGADTVALTEEIHRLMDDVPQDWFIHGYEPVRVTRRKRRARRVTHVEGE